MDSPHGAAVRAENLGLKGPYGWAFRGVDVDAEPGALIAVEGPSGSGRTCLLLALTGRMRTSEGHAEVAGFRLPGKPAEVRRISALGPVPGVSELDPALTVDEHLRERVLLQRRYSGSLRALLRPRSERRAAARSRIGTALEAAGLDPATLPKQGRTSVRDLERLEALRLSVALGLLGGPRLLAVDDADLKLSGPERDAAWELLRSVAASGVTTLAVCSSAPEGAVTVSTRPAADRADTADARQQKTNARQKNAQQAAQPQDEPQKSTQTEKGAETVKDTGTEQEGAADALAETGRP
ncbi:ATP-binding cassette domain-containing protein [Streptomyces sp. NPDC059398]|uniref:ATP-binding cassette domain-containing protein n=1 Tax=Streptomyces sp. NPDC059398 TaxID=3346820 RepID=UPI0036CCDFD0